MASRAVAHRSTPASTACSSIAASSSAENSRFCTAATLSSSWATLLAQWADRALRSGHQNLLSEAQPEMERTLLTTALRHTQGHKQEAARLLGWGRNTLTRKLKELGME